MNRKMISSLAILSLFLISAITVTTGSCADYTKAGVKPGDVAEYYMTSNDPHFNGERMVMTIINVTGAIVSDNRTFYYKNGTIIQFFSMVFTGNVSEAEQWFWLIPPNLQKGDQIFPAPGEPTITNTTNMKVAGIQRSVDHWYFLWFHELRADYYWDQETGILVNWTEHDWSHGWNSSWILTYTNAWAPGPLESLIVFAVVLITIIGVPVAVFIMDRRRRS